MIPFSPDMPVLAVTRRGWLFHDRELFTALFAGDDP